MVCIRLTTLSRLGIYIMKQYTYYSVYISEYPYWWKKLEDTSLTQLSTDSKILNQTSRHLDSNSQIETSQVTGEWWKILDVSSIPNSPKINEDIVEKSMFL